MNQTVGINQENQLETNQSSEFGRVSETLHYTNSPQNITSGTFQKGDLSFTVDFKVETGRTIRGVAHFPEVDLEKELILMEAISKALPSFMKHPILHLQHTERPVGIVTEANIENNSFVIKADIFDDEDTDDVWEDIVKGKLYKFSIYGRRTVGSHECKLHPRARTNPCITKAIRLWSISVVSGNAINQRSFFEVVKSLVEIDDTFINGNDNTEMSIMENVVEKCNTSGTYEKSEGGIEVYPADMSSILDRMAKIEQILNKLVESDKKVHASMEGNMEEKANGGAEQVAHPEAPVKKAEEEVIETSTFDEDALRKSFMDEVSNLRKAYDEKFETILTEIKKSTDAYTALEDRIKKVENETIVKGGNVVVVEKDVETPLGKPMILADRIANLEAMR